MNTQRDFSLYLHIPYCVKKCPYCDFNSYGVGESKGALAQEQAYTAALIGEIQHYSGDPEFSARPIVSIFFGGGTPSLFSAAALGEILQAVFTCFPVSSDAEITLEANPGTIFEDLGLEKLCQIREYGFNRISLGAQSFSDKKLKLLGRIHLAADTKKAVQNVKAAGFSNFNLDLISGINGETEQDWKLDLDQACSLNPTHISAYCLTIEPGTEFSRRTRLGETLQSNEEISAEMLSYTYHFLKSSGYGRYEISNYAKKGFECLHNIGYWSGRDYLGIGAGAHSFVGPRASADNKCRWGKRWSNIPGPEHYIQQVSSRGCSLHRLETLSEKTAEIEFFFLGLRQKIGINRAEYQKRFSRDLESNFRSALAELRSQELISAVGEQILLTEKGFLFADSVFNYFAAD